jgi:dihydrofolate reductase
MKISMIVAMDDNNGIGNNNKLLWHIPKDLKWMKEKTMGRVIVMGRNSYEDIITYTKGKPLPGRTNVVLSSKDPSEFNEGFVVVKTIDEVIKKFANEEKIFILGGAQVYKSFLPLADELIITHVQTKLQADAFFPQVDYSLFNTVYQQDEQENGFNFTFKIYEKK